jgi:hypothetical protein
VSVPEVKEYLGLTTNLGLIPLPNIKDHWSSEWKTQIKFFGHIMSRDSFSDILDDACGEIIPPKKATGPSKEQRKYMG